MVCFCAASHSTLEVRRAGRRTALRVGQRYNITLKEKGVVQWPEPTNSTPERTSRRGRSYVPQRNQGPHGHRIDSLMMAVIGDAMTPADVLDPSRWYPYDKAHPRTSIAWSP